MTVTHPLVEREKRPTQWPLCIILTEHGISVETPFRIRMVIWKAALKTRKLGIRSYSECGVVGVGGRPRTAENKEKEEGYNQGFYIYRTFSGLGYNMI